MRSFLKKAFLVLLALVLLPLVAGAGVAAVGYAAGTMTLEIEAEGRRFSVPLPAGLVPAAIRFLPGKVCREIDSAMGSQVADPWSLVRAAADGIESLPDAVLVEAEDGSDRIRVTKQDRRMLVSLESSHEAIRVAVPVRVVSAVARQLESRCRGL